jgi:hypothetical protein
MLICGDKMYELIFIIVAIGIGLFIKYAFIQESQRPYPHHSAFAGVREDFLNWGKENPKAGVFTNLMIIELHIYFGILSLNPAFGMFWMLYIIYIAMFGVWVLLGSLLCIVEAAEGLSWKKEYK